MKLETVGNVPGNVLGMLADLMHKLRNGVLTTEQLGLFLKKENPFESVSNLLAEWTRFWQKFGLTVGDITIPEKRPGFDRLLVIPKGLTIEQIFQICRNRLFNCWKYTDQDLDKTIPVNDRMPTGKSYAIWIRERVEADEEFKNQSANQLKTNGHVGVTVIERLVFEAKYFDETSGHLDIHNDTLCAGSRDSDGGVPRMSWYSFGGQLAICWCGPGSAEGGLRSREVVS